MRAKAFSLVLLFVLILSGNAQDSTISKFQYGGMQQIAVILGERGTNIGLTLINGVRFHRFFVGLGADIQFGNYNNRFTNSALFADGRYYINKKKNFFAKVNGGATMIHSHFYSSDFDKYKKRPGYYGAFGIGFKAKRGNEVFYSFDLTYGFRQHRYDYTYRSWWTNQWQTEKYDIRRSIIMLHLGLEIF